MGPDEPAFAPANPYASPTIPMAPSETDEAVDDRNDQLAAFIGRNASYYLSKWTPSMYGAPGNPGFNWAAFFLTGFWISYRKMYKFAAIFYGAILLVAIAEELLFVEVLGVAEVPGSLDGVFNIVTAVICGFAANRLYLRHADNVISEVSAAGVRGEARLHMLATRGGTSMVAALGIFALYVITTFVLFAAIDIALYGF